MPKNLFFSHEYIQQKMGGKKTREKFFPEHPNCIRKICWEKNLRKKVRNNVLYIYTNIVKKMGGNNARNNFYRRTRIVPTKNVGKKLRRKNVRKMFFIFIRKS